MGTQGEGEPVNKDRCVVDKLYVSKKTLKIHNNPGLLRVTIEIA